MTVYVVIFRNSYAGEGQDIVRGVFATERAANAAVAGDRWPENCEVEEFELRGDPQEVAT